MTTPEVRASKLHRDIISYWERFYSASEDVPANESDFARWVTAQIPTIDILVEFGCGTGRDAVWFANSSIGLVVATDASKSGLERLTSRIKSAGCSNLLTAAVDLNSPHSLASLSQKLTELVAGHNQPVKIVFYGRFLLHAIEKAAQEALLEFAASHLRAGDFLALEYRVSDLGQGGYAFGDHYRRPINPDELEEQCLNAGFAAVHTVTSDTFSVLHNERPLIGRTLAKR